MNDLRDIPPVNINADVIPDSKSLTGTSSKNRKRISTLTAACNRYLISDYPGASSATDALINYALSQKDDKNQGIGPHQLQFASQNYRLKRQEFLLARFENLTSLYIDGRKAATHVMIKNEKTSTWSSKLMVKNHIIIFEDDDKYLTHVNSNTGHGKTIVKNYSRDSGEEKSNQATYCICWK